MSGGESRLRTEVIVEFEATDEDLRHLREAFADTRIDADVRAGYMRLSAGELPPVTYVVAAAAAFLSLFVSGVATEAGKDAYKLLKRLIRHAVSRPSRGVTRNPRAAFLIQDRDNGFEILFHGDEPDEAFAALFAIDLEDDFAGAGVVAWTNESKTWEPVGVSSWRLAPGRRRGRRAPKEWP